MKWKSDPHERLVFHVESRSGADKWHRVDLEADGFKGECSCEHYRYRMKKERKDGGRGECLHIKVALVAFARSILQEIKKEAKKSHGTSRRDVGPD